MIEFYYKFFRKQYSRHVEELISDISCLMRLYGIKNNSSKKIILPEEFSKNLPIDSWKKINSLYETLLALEDIPSCLRKFINKTHVPNTIPHRFIDLFAGCGGLSLGLEKAGFVPYFVNEIEPNYLISYYFNNSISLDHYFCGDIRELNVNDISLKIKGVDLVAGGPPCQGFSMANRQRMVDDPRNVLYKYYLDFLSYVRPKFFIMENVKGILSRISEIKEDFQHAMGDKYSIEFVLLNAKDFGIPQNRERVIIIGSRVSSSPASLIAKEILCLRDAISKHYVLKDALFGLPILMPNRDKLKDEFRTDDVGKKFRFLRMPSFDFGEYINDTPNQCLLSNHTNRYNNDRDIEIYTRLPQGANSLHPSISDIMPYSSRNGIFKDKYYKLDEMQVCKTITTHMKFDCNMYIHPTQSRGLSPREAARIQTFPDDFIFMGSNNNWYGQIGNAVPVKLAEVIGSTLMRHLK